MFEFVCKLGRIIIKYLLELCDKQLMLSRDKKVYRHKGYKSTCIKTIMGPVEFKRVVYEHTDENGNNEFIYLLDEYLNLETIGFMSTNLVEKVIGNATNVSYRKTAKNITEMTGQSISHTAAWNVTQELGKRIVAEEKKKVEKYYKGELNGKKEVKVLFEEADGLWINMQGKDRPKKGNSRKREIKLAVTYEGWEKKNEKTARYILHNKRAVAGFMDAEGFNDLRDTNIAEEYNVDKIEVKVVGGDGADWIKHGIDEQRTYFQLDRYHISESVIRNVYDKKEAKRILKMLNSGKEDKAIERIRELMYECGGEEDKVKKLQALETYLENNKEGLRLYKERDEIKLPELPEGLEYRNMGTAEHNICDILKLRMKGNKTSWSISGANNLAKILAVKASGNLYQTIPIYVMFICFIIFSYILSKTRFGRNIFAIGGNPEAARLAGINSKKIIVSCYIMTSVFAGVAGIVLAGRMSSGNPSSNANIHFDAITAANLGGVSMVGGVGSIPSVVLGILLVQFFNSGLNMANVSQYWQFVAKGLLLLGSLALDYYRQVAREKKLLADAMKNL